MAGMVTRGAQYGAIFGGGGRRGNNNDNSGAPVWLIVLVVSLVVYAVSFLLTRAALALPRAVPPTGPAPSSPGSRRRWPAR